MRICTGLCVAALLVAGAGAAAEPLRAGEARRLLLLDFELIDEQAGVTPFPEAAARLAMAGERLRERLGEAGIYAVLDDAPIADALLAARRANLTLLDCKGCELDLARQLGAERVMLAWVQRVSNLILNLNIEVRDVTTGRTLLNKSVDMRGNTDRSWRRAVDFVVRDMADRGQHNR
ncbi:MAG: DUF3280 domain-containing protein [Rhodocyclaceae bacterium]|nr:DUF3280 domain-containing protein [Rhodocyclaceae bacterium]